MVVVCDMERPQWSVEPAGSSLENAPETASAPTLSIALPDEAATARLAAQLAFIARAGDVIALAGDLGAGKTAFARAFIRARLRVCEDVPSPTFTLVQIYEGAEPKDPAIWHFDLYRLDAPEDGLELDIEDAFASAISLIEWPERLGALLPARRLLVRLEPGDTPDSRCATLDGGEAWRDRLAAAASLIGEPDPPQEPGSV